MIEFTAALDGKISRRTLYLHQISVSPQSIGIGHAVLLGLLQNFPRVNRMVICTAASNKSAIRFYKTFGKMRILKHNRGTGWHQLLLEIRPWQSQNT